MTSTPRLPKAELTGLYGYVIKRFSRKMFGEIAEPAEVMWHNVATPIWLNGAPGARIDIGGDLTMAVSVVVADGRITRAYAVVNPNKVAGLGGIADLTRT